MIVRLVSQKKVGATSDNGCYVTPPRWGSPRGLLQPGYAADVTAFDPATVKDQSTFADPHRYPTGIPYVVVNGALVVDREAFNAAGTDRVLTP